MKYFHLQITHWCFCLLVLAALCGCEIGAKNESSPYDPTSLRKDGQALITTEDMLFKLQYTPVEWRASQAGASTLEEYLGHLYFQMKIQPKTTKHSLQDLMAGGDASEQWNDFLFRQKENFTLWIGEEELPCVLYHVTPAGISGQGVTLNLVFKDSQPNRSAFEGAIHLDYQDDLWTQSLLTFDFVADELNQLPLPEFDNY